MVKSTSTGKTATPTKAKTKPKARAKPEPTKTAAKKAADKRKPAATKRAGQSGQSSTRAAGAVRVPPAVTATLANAQQQLAALQEHPQEPFSTEQDQRVAPAAGAPSEPIVLRTACERMPRDFWGAINTLCDRPEAVREAYRRGDSGPGTAMDFARVAVLAGAAYGAAMGATNWLQGAGGYFWMLPLSAIKLPLLFLATYLFSLAPLYLVSRFLGYPFTLAQAAKLLLAATSVTAATLAGAIPIALLFAMTTDSYTVMQLVHGLLLSVGGFMGALFFTTRCHAIHGRHATIRPLTLMGVYILLHVLIALQLAYVSGPYIGAPDAPFEAVRARSATIIEGMF